MTPEPAGIPESASPDPEDLVRRFRGGDEAAFQLLLERYGDVLVRRIRRDLPPGLRRRVTIQDVLQDACLSAYRARGRFESEDGESFRNWLLGIVDNKLKEAVRFHAGTARRAIGRETTRSSRPATQAARGRGPSPSAYAIGQETHERVRVALEALPESYREILILTRQERLPLREAAERMGRGYEATKKLYGRALAQLQRELDGE